MGFLRNLLTLGRISNLPTVWTNCLAAWTVNAFASPIVREMPNPIEDLDLLAWGQLGWLLRSDGLNHAREDGDDDKGYPHAKSHAASMSLVRHRVVITCGRSLADRLCPWNHWSTSTELLLLPPTPAYR